MEWPGKMLALGLGGAPLVGYLGPVTVFSFSCFSSWSYSPGEARSEDRRPKTEPRPESGQAHSDQGSGLVTGNRSGR